MGSKKKQKQSQQSPLPSQYQFFPRTTAPPVPNRRSPPGVSDYPPPRQLFQDSHAQTEAASAHFPQPSPPPPPEPRRTETSAARNGPSSSEAQDSASTERPEAVNPTLSDGFLRQINELISQPNRGRDIPILSPNFEPGTTCETASVARLSERNGLGPHKHNTGQKSFQQIEYEMVEELGRPVSLGEVYIKTHTKKDGTYVDLKAEQVAEIYKKNKEAKLTALEAENSESSDGASNDRQLSIEEDTEIFLLSTFTDERGHYYGIGSLQQTLVNGKRKYSEVSSSAFLDMNKQLEEAHRKIEEQAASNAAQATTIAEQGSTIAEQGSTIAEQGATIAEQGATIAEQAKQINEFAVVKKFLSATDHRFDQFVSTNSTT
ncbi:hypothetical protein Bca4012_003483 [Brassica carinata]